MAGSLLDRAWRLLSLLAANASGLPLQRIVNDLGVPKSAAHRLLTELTRLDLTRQDPSTGHYLLTTKLLSLGFTFLSSSGVVDVAQPILDGMARESGELVRMTVCDGKRLTWIAKSQGAKSGLRYDPEMGQHPVLFCTATGQAWLSTLDERIVGQIIMSEGFGRLKDFGPNAPRTISAFQRKLNRARIDGYAAVVESAAVGSSAIAAAIILPRTGQAIGTVSIAGPSFRLTEGRMKELAPKLLFAASELGNASIGSGYLTEMTRISDADLPLCSI